MTTLPTHRPTVIEIAVLIAVTAAVAWMLYSVPSWRDATAGSSLAATLAAIGVAAFLWVSLWLGGRTRRAELWLLAAFLCGMPVVYVAQYLVAANAKPRGWFWLEVAAIPVFATLAVLGVKISPWFLVIGIVAHGLAWDSWHYRHSAYIPDWYSTGCLLVDITIGAYAAVRFSFIPES
jgi:hypothetical protein